MDPLNEGKSFLKGESLSRRMEELASMISKEHAETKAGWSQSLEHARNAGEWLIEAKWRKGHRTKWGRWKRWLAKEYDISTRTMSQYMQIARCWDDPRIIEIQSQGIPIDNISSFLQVLRGHNPQPKQSLTTKEMERDANQKSIRKEFAAYLRTLDGFETTVLCATIEDVLEAFNDNLQERVCGNYAGPYYAHRKEASSAMSATDVSTGAPPSRHHPLRRKRSSSQMMKQQFESQHGDMQSGDM